MKPRNRPWEKATNEKRNGNEQRGLEAAREHREDLEALAETELPASTWAKRLLDILDEQDTGGDSR